MDHRAVQRAFAAGFAATSVGSSFAIGAVSASPTSHPFEPTHTERGATFSTATFDVTGIESFGVLGSAGNTVIEFDLGAAIGVPFPAPFEVTSIGWDVTITTFGGSFLSDASIYFDDNINPDMAGLFLRPGISVNSPGSQSFTSNGLIDLSDNGILNIPIINGILRLEFFEQFDDVVNGTDAIWSGTITIGTNYIPTPGAASLVLISGAFVSRRRR